MKKISRILFILLAGSFSLFVYAQDDSNALTQLLLQTHTLQADFSQTTQDGHGKVLHQATGHMDLLRPGKFRWDVLEPNKQLIIANGHKLWIYDPDLEQVTIRALSKAAGQSPALLLSDSQLQLGADFTVKQVAQPAQIAGLKKFRLLPKDKDSLFTVLFLNFLNQHIESMELQDHLGNTTRITFKNVKVDAAIPAATFTFTPPSGVDVIDETQKRN